MIPGGLKGRNENLFGRGVVLDSGSEIKTYLESNSNGYATREKKVILERRGAFFSGKLSWKVDDSTLPNIVLNLSWTYTKIQCKREAYCFSGSKILNYKMSDTQIDIQLLLYI